MRNIPLWIATLENIEVIDISYNKIEIISEWLNNLEN